MLKEPFPLSLPPTNSSNNAISNDGGGYTVRPLAAAAGWDKPSGDCLEALGVVSGNVVGRRRSMTAGDNDGEEEEGERTEQGEALDLLTSAAFLFKHSRRNLG